ncbi:hypothetical protein Ahy_A05g022338 [Arachis hypogaea]|uniref:RNase H type-1 domain-containing protein n=1 Tax=Arachis hypogaea TaxID=3818 RepID=A0A445D0G3_ARAHY|nr:hypothetical protein Ahy_A05g022338 [Arachis hypogaea]
MEMTWTLGFRKVWFECDSKAVITAIQSHKEWRNSSSVLYSRIHEYMKRDWDIRISHVYREANGCADWLANFSINQEASTQIWNTPRCSYEYAIL